MLPQVQIPVQPSSTDCLAWSSDGELAIAAGEEVYLLIPWDGSPVPWVHVRITVNRFTFEEWPRQEQASFKDMSIGEEQARVTVTALAWSPPGLAKHRRSVLAVLTSNLILSLWASNSYPSDLNSWERILVVNKVLHSGSRSQQRIRSMAWAPTNPQHVDRQTPFSRSKWGIPLMAIADDCNGLYILRVSSPFAGQSFAWDIEVLHHETVPVSKALQDRPSLFSLVMNANHFVDHIEFGTWNCNLAMVYRTSGAVHYASISIQVKTSSRERSEEISDCGSFTVNLGEASSSDTNMPLRTTVTPLIKTQMIAEKERFSLANKYGNHVMLRRWGLASFNKLVAACITLHPAKMVDYIAPFDGISTILFDTGDEHGSVGVGFPWQDHAQVDVTEAQREILDTVLDQNLQKYLAINDFDLKILYTAFCGCLLLRDDKRLQRLEGAAKILNLIESHASISLLAERRTLLSINGSPNLPDQQLINVIKRMTEARIQEESSLCSPEKALFEPCPFCPENQNAIPFESFTAAYCPQRHSFGTLIPSPDSSLSHRPYSKVRSYLPTAP